ncbi:MAG: MBL fold metallo-hydrolase [Actinobacteria bacterium]|nr:MBL fold metallo-hydrolase [Actinomycetota bacterium]
MATGDDRATATEAPNQGNYAPPLVQGEPVEVDDGVFVILDRRVSLVPNVGIVVGDDAALVIDTGVGPRNGAYVLGQARRLAGDLPLYLAITQLDPGHGFGAQAFKGEATVIYNLAQRERLRYHAHKYIDTFRQFGPAVEAEFAGLELVEPDIVFGGELEIDLGGTVATLRQWGPAHTVDDQTALIDDRVLFGGDLFENRMFPILPFFPPFDSHFDGARWIEALEDLIAAAPPVVVPGHGEVTDVGQIRAVLDYLRWVEGETRQRCGAGASVEEAAAAIESEARERWSDWETPQWIKFAVRAFHQEAVGGSGR